MCVCVCERERERERDLCYENLNGYSAKKWVAIDALELKSSEMRVNIN